MMGLSSTNAPELDLPARYMALSIAALTALAASAPWTLSLVQGGFSDFSLLALVHLATLGFVGSMLIGASYQLVPVAIQVGLSSVRLGRVSFWFYLSGLGLFLLGLYQTWLTSLAVGATLLGVGFLLYIGIILTTWWRAPHHDVIAWHIALAALHSGAGMVAGFLLAINKGNGMLGDRLLQLLAAHIALMLLGWVALTFTGVAYRLIGMFTLSESYFRPWLAWLELGLVAGGTWLLALRFLLAWPVMIAQLSSVMLVAGFVCFGVQINRLYRRRMRRNLDIHVPFAVTAALMAFAAATTLCVGLFVGTQPNDPVWVLAIWLGLFGTAGTAIQGFFYKIATFLVWLKRYAPVAGRQAVPKLEDLYNRRLAMIGWVLWTLAIFFGAVAILSSSDVMPLVGIVLLASVTCFVINVGLIGRHWISRGAPAARRPDRPAEPVVSDGAQ